MSTVIEKVELLKAQQKKLRAVDSEKRTLLRGCKRELKQKLEASDNHFTVEASRLLKLALDFSRAKKEASKELFKVELVLIDLAEVLGQDTKEVIKKLWF